MTVSLEVRAVDKRFGAVHAVREATLAFEPGRIHAVVGENGAGKSTLLKIAAGLVTPDAGESRIDGAPLVPHTPGEALRRGVAMVQQHFALVEAFTALENVVLGAEPVAGLGRVDWRAARAKVTAAASALGALPLDAEVRSLGVGDRQRLEIARALYRDARVLICDEPTAVLTPGEADALYGVLRKLADAGRTVVVVTHKLDEVRDHADVATVMRRGAIVETRAVTRTDSEVRALTAIIMGGSTETEAARSAQTPGGVVIRVTDARLGRALGGVDLEVRAGEIVGLAGVEGNGQRELVRVLAGLERLDGGSVAPTPSAISVVHEDRQIDGLVLDATVRDNLLLGELAHFTRGGVLQEAAMDREASARVNQAGGHVDLDVSARTLSGGNQQKLVVERAIARLGARAALVVAHPTRGVDLAASRAIHGEIAAAAARGAAVLVVSADMHELRTLADRLLVMARGRVSAELPATATDEEIGRAMLAVEARG